MLVFGFSNVKIIYTQSKKNGNVYAKKWHFEMTKSRSFQYFLSFKFEILILATEILITHKSGMYVIDHVIFLVYKF